MDKELDFAFVKKLCECDDCLAVEEFSKLLEKTKGEARGARRIENP